MGTCKHCNAADITISDAIGFCADCIRNHFEELSAELTSVHEASRTEYGLPAHPPRAEKGKTCVQCFHRCSIPEGGTGYCGIRHVKEGKLRGGRPHEGNLAFYHDPLPTNCVADFVCPGGTSCGFPKYSVASQPEYGYRNLAVFHHACSFNCLYCQNSQFKEHTFMPISMAAQELADAADEGTTCICYFGGDPTPQIQHALAASRLAVKNAGDRIMRICWETNGAAERPFMKKMLDLSLKSGGCIKFDIKAWDKGIHYALCGVPNDQTLSNVEFVSSFMSERPDPPLMIASTLLVPGYVDEPEVARIASFLSALNPHIPYRLLAFHPHFWLRDLPSTSKSHAMRCRDAAEKAGLKTVNVGNLHLLGDDYP
jgi:pyruvate formate lyase activating enzyme